MAFARRQTQDDRRKTVHTRRYVQDGMYKAAFTRYKMAHKISDTKRHLSDMKADYNEKKIYDESSIFV